MPSYQRAAETTGVYLAERARDENYAGVYPRQLVGLMPVDQYQQFLRTRLDRKGLLASAFGSVGASTGVSLSIDFADFLPGLMVGLQGTAEVNAAGTAMLIIHHSMPRQLLQAAVDPQQAPARPLSASANGAPRQIWSSSTPICFMSMFGTSLGVIVGVQGNLYFAQEPPIPEDSTAQQMITASELSLGLSVGAAARASYRYDRLYALDASPGWYTQALDAGLRSDFLGVVQTGRIRKLKEEINQWLKQMDRYIVPLTSRLLVNPSPQAQRSLIAALHDKVTAHAYGERKGTLDKLTDVCKQALAIAGNAVPENVRSFFTVTKGLFEAAQAEFTDTDELLKSLAQLYNFIPDKQTIDAIYREPQVVEERQRMITAMTGLKEQARNYYWRLKGLTEAPIVQDSATASLKQYGKRQVAPHDKYNCFLKIASHEAEVGGGIEANVSYAQAGTGAAGRIKESAYRYQTYTPSDQPASDLIYTQDTSISYRQVTVTAGASIPGVAVERSKGLIVNALKYRSIGIYWLYPTGAEVQVPVRMGSGVSFGVSVARSDLITCINAIRQSRQRPSLVRRLAAYLRVTEDRLGNFLEKLPVAVDLSAYPSLLIESNFRLSRSIMVPLRARGYRDKDSGASGTLKRLVGLWENGAAATFAGALSSQSDNYLDAIRLRMREADAKESEIAFKLGLYMPTSFGSDLGAGIKLAKIDRAGQHVVSDLYCRYYPIVSADPATGSLPPVDHSLRVPPVALLHQ